MSRSAILWHGTTLADPAEVAPRPSALDAVWLSGDPLVASVYAGTGGHVHGFVLRDGVSLADASGNFREGPHQHMSEAQWALVRSMLADMSYDLDELDMTDDFKIANGFMPPLLEGRPCWAAFVEEAVEMMTGEPEAILRALGFHGVARCERPLLAINDAASRSGPDPDLAAAVNVLRSVADRDRLAVGVLDPASLVHVATLPARAVMRAARLGAPLFPVTGAADVAAALASAPDPEVGTFLPTP